MVGTLFLWMYWPSFNGALASGSTQQRVVLNTVLALTGSCMTTFVVSRIAFGKLNMELVLNATLAGGVAIGTSSDLVVSPAIAIIVGCVAGLLSSLGFAYLSGWLQKKIGLHDTCGVHNLHGMPGVLGGILGMICTAASKESHGIARFDTFGEMFWGRTIGGQVAVQAAALALTLAISIVSGLLAGFIASRSIF